MRVPGLIFASEGLLAGIGQDQALEQVANVATLPGIVRYSLAMPDVHWGYGFPVGGVAAMRTQDGVVSPGGVGFDINCGVRLLRTDLQREEVLPHLQRLVDQLYRDVPSGLGEGGAIRLSDAELEAVMTSGSLWAVQNGHGDPQDLEATEENGRMAGADPRKVSARARQRGRPQLGTLGSGNHFLEVAYVDEVYDRAVAEAFDLHTPGQVVVWIHCGSRGLGHQVCDDFLKVMDGAMLRYGIEVPDRQLACAPISSPEGKDYLAAHACAVNFAFANRQAIAAAVRRSFEAVFGRPAGALGIRQVYDVAHNIAKIEQHLVDGQETELCVHRKGATRSLPPGHPDVPLRYRAVGQPVLIPGDMGRYSFVCVGTSAAMTESWGSACHGAGRVASRTATKKALKGQDVEAALRKEGIIARGGGWAALAEEMPQAYKDVAEVVRVTDATGLAR
ncbi:MAG: RtcB family protein, partial [Chloroflexi bacterium]|nr:RtcB family protein [Chloroflexota bacterium]